MLKRLSFLILLCLFGLASYAQKNFTFTPEKPKSGDLVTISYTPSGELANTLGKVEAQVFISSTKGRKADDLTLTKSGKKYTATIQTDSSNNFIQFGFYADDKFDSNFKEGYFIQLYKGDKLKKGSNISLASFYQYYCEEVGAEPNKEKVLMAYENELSLYPEYKKNIYIGYLRALASLKREEAVTLIEKEIELVKQSGLNNESDFIYLRKLYNSNNNQVKFLDIVLQAKRKFPDGQIAINEIIEDYYEENGIKKKVEKLKEIENNILTKEAWSVYKNSLPRMNGVLLNLYVENEEWDLLEKEASLIEDKSVVASAFNSAAWNLQETGKNLEMAERFGRFATEYTKSEWKNPTKSKPDNFTTKQWEQQRKYNYAMFADTYAMVLFRLGQYKNAYAFAKEGTLDIREGKDPDFNNTYALIAEEVLPKEQLKSELEEFVKSGVSTSDVKEVLKRVYVAEKKSVRGFDEYLVNLQKEDQAKKLEEVRKSMISEDAPLFTLKDLDGNLINLVDLKGKVLVVDFWATWCGPCLASFPSMQEMVKKYENNTDVKFLFVDTWEKGDTKEQKALEFITSNKYSFQVLMDNDNKVVEQFKVNGIPAKFVIDKEGKIRFKSTGFGGSDDALITELSLMIEMAQSSNPN